ncbi:MAG TPA: OmpA family protein [Vicinamibacterales bacterium]|jgi:outer membrane protein OmpA-like peptidoglycan-associated protein|nr:OmpA family protein [Vicinamibacterales bacterium]
MPTIIDSLRELVSPAIISAVSRQTGESESGISRGFSAAIPAIASTIAARADDQGFVKNLFDLATKTAARPPLDAVNAFTTSPTGIDTTSPIGGWLSGLFGHNLSAVTERMARYAGISGASATWLLSIAAPLVLGYIGRLVRSDNLSVSDLADVLRAQRAGLVSSLPTGFKMPEVFSAPYERARTAGEMASKGMSVPLMALLAALGIGGLIWWARQTPVEMDRVAFVEVEPPSRVVGTTGTLAGTFVRTLPGNATITIPAVGSAEDRLSLYLASASPGETTITLDRIEFDSDSAVLTADSNVQLDNIATILRAYPQAHVAVTGHTDSMGGDAANVVLSRARANTVAAKLTADGVQPQRLHAEGYGSERPIADNATEAGRAQNRRVELGVTVR